MYRLRTGWCEGTHVRFSQDNGDGYVYPALTSADFCFDCMEKLDNYIQSLKEVDRE
jgi:hypothetical protein